MNQVNQAACVRVLLVEDDRVDQLAFERAARDDAWPYKYRIVGSVAQAARILSEEKFDIIVSDYLLGDGTAFDVFPLAGTTPIVMATASGDEEVAVRAMKSGASDYLIKDPFRYYLKVLPLTVDGTLARRRDQEKLARLMKELAEANRELEAFSYSVAHDLRAPLRIINGFCNMLASDERGRMSAEGCENLERIVSQTEHMARLIDGLFALSRVDRAVLKPAPVDLAQIAGTIVERLRAEYPGRSVEFASVPVATTQADPELAFNLMQNLLQNAWKFTSHHPHARIEFGMREEDGRAIFTVRDDGAGFDPASAHRLFQGFQRLHSDERFMGTGLGLATCRRIVRHHGGEIWAEGAVENGSTFHFTLAPRPGTAP